MLLIFSKYHCSYLYTANINVSQRWFIYVLIFTLKVILLDMPLFGREARAQDSFKSKKIEEVDEETSGVVDAPTMKVRFCLNEKT